MYTDKASSNQEMKILALKHLENTYHQQFLIEDYIEKGLLIPNHHFRVKSLKYQRFFNLYLKQDNTFEDNYFSLQLENEANSYFKKIIKLKDIDTEIRVVIYNNKRPKGLKMGARFEDFINTGEALIFLYIFLDQAIVNDEKAKILSIIESTNIVQLGSFIEITNLEIIKDFDDPVTIMSQPSLVKNKDDFKLNSQQKLVFEVSHYIGAVQ